MCRSYINNHVKKDTINNYLDNIHKNEILFLKLYLLKYTFGLQYIIEANVDPMTTLQTDIFEFIGLI